MATQRINVMISSRCNDRILARDGSWRKLTDLRLEAKAEIEDAKYGVFDLSTFECVVHEDQPAAGAETWEQCLEYVRDCDILIVLYNRDAGFANSAGDVGICHAEVMEGLRTAPGKVRIIEVAAEASQPDPAKKITPEAVARNERFAEFLGPKMQRWKRFAQDYENALHLIREAVQDAVVDLARLGGREVRKGNYYEGPSLDWSRKNFADRKEAMEAALLHYFVPGGDCIVQVGQESVLFECHAVPSSMSTAAAREMVGRPFLRDHELLDEMPGKTVGPVHLIACHKGVTETQAMNLLGFPDATIVAPPFGVYVADPVQNMQMVFLANCRDESSTRFAAQRFRDWLQSSDEAEFLAERARKRKLIVTAIAKAAASAPKQAKRSAAGGK